MSNVPATLRLTLSPRLSELTRIRNELDRYLRDCLLPDTVRNMLLVITEEVLANIVHHGGCNEASDPIEVTVNRENAVVHMEFIDAGKPFDPLKEPGRATAEQLVNNREPGGFGLHLVRELTNHQKYTRKADRNHFRITKHIQDSMQEAGPNCKTGQQHHARNSDLIMNWTQEIRQGNIIVFPGGPLDQENAEDCESRLVSSVEEASRSGGSLIIDFRGVDYMSSVGLRALMMAAKQAEPASVKVLVTGMNETMQEIFCISGFEKLFVVYDSLESALAATSAS